MMINFCQPKSSSSHVCVQCLLFVLNFDLLYFANFQLFRSMGCATEAKRIFCFNLTVYITETLSETKKTSCKVIYDAFLLLLCILNLHASDRL